MQRSAADNDRAFAMLIGNEWASGQAGDTFACVDPFTEESWGRVPRASAADVDRAVRAARAAFDTGTWPGTAPARRAALLRRLAELIAANADALAYQQIRENGKLVSEMRPASTCS